VFVCPPWAWRKFEASDDLVLFTFSDRPVQEKLGLWREERSASAQ
jgi:gentisate 1,2-dioxygenase